MSQGEWSGRHKSDTKHHQTPQKHVDQNSGVSKRQIAPKFNTIPFNIH